MEAQGAAQGGEGSGLPDNIKTYSLQTIAEALTFYYATMSKLIRAHYTQDVTTRDATIDQALEAFNVIFQRLRSNLIDLDDEYIPAIEAAILNPDYNNPDQYIPEVLYPAFIVFNKLIKESGLDNLIEYEAPIYRTRGRPSNLSYSEEKGEGAPPPGVGSRTTGGKK